MEVKMEKIGMLGTLCLSLAIMIVAFNGGIDNKFETIDVVAGWIFFIISIITVVILNLKK